MKKDSEHKTGEIIIEKLNRDALLELYSTEDIQKDYRHVRKMLDDKSTSTKDRIALLRLVWEYVLEKPKTTSEVKINGGFSGLSEEELDSILKKYQANESVAK